MKNAVFPFLIGKVLTVNAVKKGKDMYIPTVSIPYR